MKFAEKSVKIVYVNTVSYRNTAVKFLLKTEFDERAGRLLSKESYDVYDLAELVSLLRCEYGCPWDKVQTHETIRRDLLEETYEVLEGIDCGSPDMLREELGDLLLQVIFHTDIEREAGSFDLADVADEVCKKLILRHPHVFGNVQADTPDQVLKNWDQIKMGEKHQESYTETLESVPKVFPSLMRAQKLGKRAGRAGVEFESEQAAERLLRERVAEGADTAEIMFLCANIVRLRGGDAEEELERGCDAFIRRFAELEKNGRLGGTEASELYFTK